MSASPLDLEDKQLPLEDHMAGKLNARWEDTSWAWLPEAKFFHDWGVEWPHGGPGLDTTMSLELWCPWLPLWTTKLGKGWVGHASPSPPAPNPSQHQSLFQ